MFETTVAAASNGAYNCGAHQVTASNSEKLSWQSVCTAYTLLTNCLYTQCAKSPHRASANLVSWGSHPLGSEPDVPLTRISHILHYPGSLFSLGTTRNTGFALFLAFKIKIINLKIKLVFQLWILALFYNALLLRQSLVYMRLALTSWVAKDDL